MGAAIPSSARVSTSCWIHSCLGWCPQPWQPGATSQGHQAGPSSLPWGSKVTAALCPCPAGRSTLGQPPLVLCKAHSCVSTLCAPGRAGTGLVRHGVGHSLLPAAPAALAPRLELCTGPVPWCRALHSWNSRAQPLQQTNAQVYSLAKALPVLDPREKFRNCSANTHGRCGNLVTGLYLQKKAVA